MVIVVSYPELLGVAPTEQGRLSGVR